MTNLEFQSKENDNLRSYIRLLERHMSDVRIIGSKGSKVGKRLAYQLIGANKANCDTTELDQLLAGLN